MYISYNYVESIRKWNKSIQILQYYETRKHTETQKEKKNKTKK